MNRIAALVMLGCGVLAAGCADQPAPTMPTPPAAQAPARPTQRIVVQRGQSLDEIAAAVRVAKQEIIELNHLVPPYTLKAGATLMVPVVAAPFPKQAKARPAAAATSKKAAKHDRVAEVHSPSPRPTAPRTKPEVIPLD